MNGKFILISGSASRSCPAGKLDIAHRFVRRFTEEALRRGGGIVVLAGDEESVKDERGEPRIFDWAALREVERYANGTSDSPRLYARIIMSNEAPISKIGDDKLRLLKNLQQRNVVETHRIPRDLYTGGEYRKAMIQRADAMLAISGGKGTYSAGLEMIDLGKPVLPLDLPLGSTADDGDGAVALHREMTVAPARFFPNTHPDIANRFELLSLNREINDAEVVARVSAELLAKELDATPSSQKSRTRFKDRLASAWQAAKALPILSAAIKIIEWVMRSFG